MLLAGVSVSLSAQAQSWVWGCTWHWPHYQIILGKEGGSWWSWAANPALELFPPCPEVDVSPGCCQKLSF